MRDAERRRLLAGIADRLVESYESRGGINLIGGKNLPSRAAVVGILDELMALIFPGYHGDPVPRDADLDLLAAGRLDSLRRNLRDVIERTLRHCKQLDCHCSELWQPEENADPGGDPLTAAAGRLTMEYLNRLPDIRALLDTDVQAAYEGDPAVTNTEEIILCYPGVLATVVHRLAHPLHQMGIPLLPRIMNEWAHSVTGVDIHPGASIGPYFFIDHGTGVVIGETTIIGARVKIYQGVTLGALSFPRNPDGSLVKGGQRHPIIEDEVTIYANATILGGKTVVGRGAVIGGGVWVTASVEPGTFRTK